MSDYQIRASGPERRFEISGGLREGYDEGREWSLDDVIQAHHDWQRMTGWILGVVITSALISYGWPEGDRIRCDTEPGFVLSGAINVLYQPDEPDVICQAKLRHLAIYLAQHLNQERIYLTYRETTEILQRGGDE